MTRSRGGLRARHPVPRRQSPPHTSLRSANVRDRALEADGGTELSAQQEAAVWLAERDPVIAVWLPRPVCRSFETHDDPIRFSGPVDHAAATGQTGKQIAPERDLPPVVSDDPVPKRGRQPGQHGVRGRLAERGRGLVDPNARPSTAPACNRRIVSGRRCRSRCRTRRRPAGRTVTRTTLSGNGPPGTATKCPSEAAFRARSSKHSIASADHRGRPDRSQTRPIAGPALADAVADPTEELATPSHKRGVDGRRRYRTLVPAQKAIIGCWPGAAVTRSAPAGADRSVAGRGVR